MKKFSLNLIIIAAIIAVLGGISRLICVPFILEARVWAGTAAILLLTSIAMNTLPKE